MQKLKTCTIVLIVLSIALGSCKTSDKASEGRSKNKPSKTLSAKDQAIFDQLFFDALKEKVLDNYQEAFSMLMQCRKIDPTNAAVSYEIASLYGMHGQIKEAIPFAADAVKKDAGNVWYKVLLGELYKNDYRFDEAVKVYREIIAQRPERTEYLFELASLLMQAKKLKEAIGVYDKIEQIIGITEEISLQKERIWLGLNQPNKAIEEVVKLSNAFPDENRYLGLLAELYMMTNNKLKALEIYTKMLEKEPNSALVHISLADYYETIGLHDKSFFHVNKSFESDELDIDTKMKILLTYYDISDVDTLMRGQVIKLAETLIKIHPDNPKSYSIMGDLLYRDKQLTEAKDMFMKVISLDSSRFVVWEQVMIIHLELYDFAGLESVSSSAIALFPNQPLSYLLNGIANTRTGNYEKAVSKLKQGKDLVFLNNNMLFEFWSNLGEAHYKNKAYKESDKAFDKSLKIKPDNSLILNNYSYYLSLRGDSLEKARKMAKKAVELVPGTSSYLDTYGWVLYKLGEFDEAKIWIEKAIESNGSKNPVILEHYGDILFKLNQKEEAYEYWEKARTEGEGSTFLEEKIKTKTLVE